MRRFGRAAAVAVAALSIAVGVGLAAPTQAEQSDGTFAVPYTIHAAIAPELGTTSPAEGVAALPEAATGQDFLPAPVAEHAVATIDPTPQDDASPVKSLRELVAEYASADTDDAEHECLSVAVYFESKGESLAGQLSVAEVILNRAHSGRFPASLCGVVKQRGQFSFVRGGAFPAIARNSAHWRTAVAIAHIAREDLADGAAPKALFFHARRVSPGWRLTKVATVGNHVFYR
jgi:spore germination cell wall hydrolase CwlJ-like protein